jgi:DNA repair exonuclease SbcCD nuclease subunit
MSVTFIHTADWQIGKPFAGVENQDYRSKLGEARIGAIKRIGDLCNEHKADFVVVSGDLWDSVTPTRQLVSRTLSEIGKIPAPVYVIPGNHDYGAAGTVWHQEYFKREQENLATNLNVILDFEPIFLDKATLLPCPLLRRHVVTDLSDWLRAETDIYQTLDDKPRIVLAHGSVINFVGGAFNDEDELGGNQSNTLDLDRLAKDQLDYIALGDWHGTKEINSKSWYSGTPEPDRFPKGGDHAQGNVLLVKAGRGKIPEVETIKTGEITWLRHEFHMAGNDALQAFDLAIGQLLGNRVGEDLLNLSLTGSLGLQDHKELQNILEIYSNRVIRLKLDNQVMVNPSDEELSELQRGDQHPLVARVASKLVVQIEQGGEDSLLAREALKQLYFAI